MPGTIGEHVYRNEKEVEVQTRVMGLKKHFSLAYTNHAISDISRNELICRLIFLFRYLRIDTVFCYYPWAHDEENPGHYVLGHCAEVASWIAGRVHDYPEQIDAGFAAKGRHGEVLFSAASRDYPRGRHQRYGGEQDRRKHRQRGERSRRTPRLAAASGTGEARASAYCERAATISSSARTAGRYRRRCE